MKDRRSSPAITLSCAWPASWLATNERLRQSLQLELMALSYHALEHVVQRLLTQMGYEKARLLQRTSWRQYTKHGGLDMEAHAHVGVTDTHLIVQLKQYTRPVSRRFIDELRGTMQRLGAGQGIVITTSTFSRVARQAAASNANFPIRLIDGDELLRLLITHQIGVKRQTSAHDPRRLPIDAAFFADLKKRYPTKMRSNTHAKPSSTPQQRQGSLPSHSPNPGGVREYLNCLPGGYMLWRTHVLGGISSLWLLAAFPGTLTPDNAPLLVVLAAFSALLPDLDASESKIKHVRIGEVEPFAPLAYLIHRTLGHRGMLHSLIGLLGIGLLALPLARLGWQLPMAVVLGYASHLMLDACTCAGIPFLPWTGRRYHLLPKPLLFVTGSLAEEMLLPLLVSAVLLLLFTLLFPPA